MISHTQNLYSPAVARDTHIKWSKVESKISRQVLLNNQLGAQFFFMIKHMKNLFVRLVIYKDYTQMHGQQNIKLPTSVGVYLQYQISCKSCQ